MQFNNQKTRNVADAVAKILAGESAKQEPKMLEEELKGNQHKIDANKNNKVDAHDFKLLRAKKEVKKEGVEQIAELKKSTLGSYVKKAAKDQAGDAFEHGEDEHRQYGDPGEDPERDKDIEDRERRMANREKGIGRAVKRLTKEEVEQEEEKSMTFSEMLAAYKEHGLAVIAEEPTEEEFNKEIKKAQAKSEGKEKADVAKASVQAVKQEEIEVLDANVINGVEQIDIEERTLTKPEANKKEEIVKSMKKKMSGFKERYGERAKNVMYATATKMAKKD
jgi:hypothetical protein